MNDDLENVLVDVQTFRLRAAWCHSLKEKRMVVKSLVSRIQNQFHISVAEVAEQDIHQIIVIGVVAIVPDSAFADSLMDSVSAFVEDNTDAEMIGEYREIR